MKQALAVVVMSGLLALSTPGWAESASEESTLGQIGVGVGSVVGSVVYFPFKAAFCILGAIGAGFTLVAAGAQTADKVVSASCRGTWVITPDVVKGKESVHFVGQPPSPKSEGAGAK